MASHRKGPAERRYCHVQVRVWTDEKTTQWGLPAAHPLTLWTYLLTCPFSLRVPGVIVAGRAAMAEALGWELADFDRCWNLLEAEGLVVPDWKARLVYLPGTFKQPENHPGSPPTVVTWKRELMNAPECSLLRRIVKDVRALLAEISPAYVAAFEAGTHLAARRSSGMGREMATTVSTTGPSPQPSPGPATVSSAVPDPAPDPSPDPDPPLTPVVSSTRAIPRAQSGGGGKPAGKTEPGAYAVLDAFQQAAGRVLLLDLVPQVPPPSPGLTGRLPMGLEGQWCALLTAYKAEHEIGGSDLLARVKRAGEYLKAGCWSWAYRGASGLPLHSLCDPRKGMFGRLLTEAAAWDGKAPEAPPARPVSGQPPTPQDVAEVNARRRQEALAQEEARRRRREEVAANVASPEEAARFAAQVLAAAEGSSGT